WFVRRRVGGAQVVDGFYKPAPEIVSPDPINDRSREKRVLWRRRPVSKRHAAISKVFEGGRFRAESACRDEFTGSRMRHVFPSAGDNLQTAGRPGLPLYPGEKTGQPKIVG